MRTQNKTTLPVDITPKITQNRYMPYTKLFASIITSTIWMEDNETRIVWITMLAISDKNGEVQASVPGLARVAGVSLAACQAALDKFLSPDEHSRTKDDEGRRAEVIPGGWALINHAKYRDLASREEDIRANAERQRRFREKQARNGKVTPKVTENENSNASVTPRNGEVTGSNAGVTESLHIAETDTNSDTDAKANTEAEAKAPAKAKADNTPTTDAAKRIAVMFRRRLTTPWGEKEIAAFKKLGKIEDEDLALLEKYYASDAPFLRHDLGTFLNNFWGEVDRARKPAAPGQIPKNQVTVPDCDVIRYTDDL